MIKTDEKLEALFFELSQQEAEELYPVTGELHCEISDEKKRSIEKRVAVKLSDGNSKGDIRIMKRKKIKTILIAAVLAVVLAFSAAAGYRFILPHSVQESFGHKLDSIKLIVDTEKADEDEISVVRKTVRSNGYIVTFEAIAESTDCIRTVLFEGQDSGEVIDSRYAILTLRREDGKQVMYGDDENDTLYPSDLGYLIMLGGYAPNPCMWDFHEGKFFYEEDNILYLLLDISDAAIFADHDISLAFTNKMVLTPDLFVCDDNGKFVFKDSYEGISAVFNFDMPDELSDKNLQKRFFSTGAFNKISTQAEFESFMAP